MRDATNWPALFIIATALNMPLCSRAQQPAAPVLPGSGVIQSAPIERRAPADPDLDLASNLIGQALFLRCFCADGNLTFAASGAAELKAKAKTLDWTLSGINIQKVERRSPAEIELDGLRVAVRYAPDRREWDRHPQKTEAMRLLVADTGDPATFRRALAAIFSLGIDRALQRSTPPYWQHFFDPQMPWPPDDLTGAVIYTGKPGPAGQTAIPPVVTHKAEPGYPAAAQRDNVQGTVQVQLVVDAQGAARRLVIGQPLGYGMDAEVAEAVEKLRWTPARLGDSAVPYALLFRQEFQVRAAP